MPKPIALTRQVGLGKIKSNSKMKGKHELGKPEEPLPTGALERAFMRWLQRRFPDVPPRDLEIKVVLILLVATICFGMPLAWIATLSLMTAETGPRTPTPDERFANTVWGLCFIATALAILAFMFRDRLWAPLRRALARFGVGHQIVGRKIGKCLERLSASDMEGRLEAIVALDRLARDWPSHHAAIMEGLCAFVRNDQRPRDEAEAAWDVEFEGWIRDELRKECGTPTNAPIAPIRPDIRAIMTLLGKRDVARDTKNAEGFVLDFHGADLRGLSMLGVYPRFADCNFRGAQLAGTDLCESWLGGSDFSGADLRGAVFYDSALTNARLTGANLQLCWLEDAEMDEADFCGADLRRAYMLSACVGAAKFRKADLRKAIIVGGNKDFTDFEGANLNGASLGGNMEEASFEGAKLCGVDFMTANLRNANLRRADLRNASFEEVNLENAYLIGAKLVGVRNMTQQQLDSASTNAHLPVPSGLVNRAAEAGIRVWNYRRRPTRLRNRDDVRPS